MAALAAFCFIALVAFPMSGADAGSSDGYSSQLDADGQLVYSQVAGALEAVQADPVNTVGVSVDLRDALVLFESTEDAEAYARETVRTALAAMYYEDPMAVWLWDLPVKDVEVEVSTGPVTTKLTDSGYEKVYFAATGVPVAECDGLVDVVRRVDGSEIALFLKEVPGGKVRGNLRAKSDRDISAVAREMGGGGHPAAAGFTVEGDIDQALSVVLPKLRALYAQEGEAR